MKQKMRFYITLEGKSTLEEKYLDAINNVPGLYKEIAISLSKVLVLGIRLNDDDEVAILGFHAEKEEVLLKPIAEPLLAEPVQEKIEELHDPQ
jgi:hypothetical protein